MKHSVTALLCLCAGILSAKVSDTEWQQAKAEAMRDLAASDATTRVSAVHKLASADRQEAADLLLRISAAAQKNLAPYAEEKEKILAQLNGFNGRTQFTQGDVDRMRKLQNDMSGIADRIRAEESVRDAVIEVLGTFKDSAAIQWMLDKPLKGSAWEDRAVVAEACASLSDAGVIPALIDRVSKDADARVLTAAIDSLGKKKATEAVAAIAGALANSSWQVQIAALQALSELGPKDAIDPIIALMEKADGRVKHECADALKRITGETLGLDAAAWKKWWADAKAGWTGPKKEDDKKQAGDPGGTTVTFYGIPVESKRVVFVLDISGSMREPADIPEQQLETGNGASPGDEPPPKKGANKLDVAKYEMKKVIRKLDPKAQFNIIFFSSSPERWQPGLIVATPPNKSAAIAYVDKQKPTAETDIFDSLEMAFNLAVNGPGNVVVSEKNMKTSVDTIYLMTDGAPNVGQVVAPADILAKIKEMNKLRKIIINTVGVGHDQDEQFLRALAEQNGGKYVKR